MKTPEKNFKTGKKQKSKKKALLLNGPNLGLLGIRQPEIYGTQTLLDIENDLCRLFSPCGVVLEALQSNHEGNLIDFLNAHFASLQAQENTVVGIIVNPGALTHTSVSLRDALEMFRAVLVPVFEVHLSNVFAREPFRHHSYISGIANGVVCGLGALGYRAAAQKILELDNPIGS